MYLSLIFFCFMTALSHNIPQMERNAGGCVTLPCKYNRSAVEGADGTLDIEWTVKNVTDPLIWLSGGKVFKNVPRLSPRISFMAHNSTTGDASVRIISLTQEDSGLYHCKVRKGAYSNLIHVNVTVLDMFDPAVVVENITEIQKNVGESVILPCGYNQSAAEGAEGNVDIEWSIRKETNFTETLICQSTVCKRNPGMSPRISLVSDNDTNGNASMTIVSLATADSGLYLCTVWKGCHILHQNTVNVMVLGGKAPPVALLLLYVFITLAVCIVLITLLFLGYCHFRKIRKTNCMKLSYGVNDTKQLLQLYEDN
ncbi:CXADR-like membrane protein isoform X1 [Acipenser oxyrinchus oxyrinchus]|uniref:CXADR-like membrane protein isoform X1 n=1 Tax=Acipenser oxyrinchus oxyrinchus TaxID=40147 RepID=A0AAD8CRQ4_ACIOX|nr:CXADR-like membrane protein isoform X1 [Acipenser oxyrinchus oxyrinchus]